MVTIAYKDQKYLFKDGLKASDILGLNELTATGILAALSLSPKMAEEDVKNMDAVPFVMAYKAFKGLIMELKTFSAENVGGKLQ